MAKETKVPAIQEQVATPSNLPAVRSFEEVIFINDKTGEISESAKEGYEPMVVPRFIYEVGHPQQYQVDLSKLIFGEVGTDKGGFEPLKSFTFIPIAVYNLGRVKMYPKRDEATIPRNVVSIVAYLPNTPRLISFMLPTWSATNFLQEYEKTGRLYANRIPLVSKLQLQFTAVPYEETSKSGMKVWALRFNVAILPPKDEKMLALNEYVASLGKSAFFCLEHFIESLSQPDNSENNKKALWIREMREFLGADGFAKLQYLAEERAAKYGVEIDSDASYQETEYQEATVISAPPAEVPEKSVEAYFKAYEKVMLYMTDAEKRDLSIKYNVSREEFKVKGNQLQAIVNDVNGGKRTITGDATDEIPF